MNLLFTINHLKNFGGAEKYISILIKKLIQSGHKIFIFAIHQGESYKQLIINGALEFHGHPEQQIDAIIISHNSTLQPLLKLINNRTPTFQICHGIFPYLEQPISNLSGYFSVSLEVQQFLLRGKIKSTLLPNPVTSRPNTSVLRDIDFLVLCQGDKANELLKKSSDPARKYIFGNKHQGEISDVESLMLRSKVVIGTGRAIIEAAFFGCAAFCFDSRHYDGLKLIGPVNQKNWHQLARSNYSGRGVSGHYSEGQLQDLLNLTLTDWQKFASEIEPLAFAQHRTDSVSEKLLHHLNSNLVVAAWYKKNRIKDLRTATERDFWENRSKTTN